MEQEESAEPVIDSKKETRDKEIVKFLEDANKYWIGEWSPDQFATISFNFAQWLKHTRAEPPELLELRELLKPLVAVRDKATQGEWEYRNPHGDRSLGSYDIDAPNMRKVAECSNSSAKTTHGFCGVVDYEIKKANAHFVTQAANVLSSSALRRLLGEGE